METHGRQSDFFARMAVEAIRDALRDTQRKEEMTKFHFEYDTIYYAANQYGVIGRPVYEDEKVGSWFVVTREKRVSLEVAQVITGELNRAEKERSMMRPQEDFEYGNQAHP